MMSRVNSDLSSLLRRPIAWTMAGVSVSVVVGGVSTVRVPVSLCMSECVSSLAVTAS